MTLLGEWKQALCRLRSKHLAVATFAPLPLYRLSKLCREYLWRHCKTTHFRVPFTSESFSEVHQYIHFSSAFSMPLEREQVMQFVREAPTRQGKKVTGRATREEFEESYGKEVCAAEGLAWYCTDHNVYRRL